MYGIQVVMMQVVESQAPQSRDLDRIGVATRLGSRRRAATIAGTDDEESRAMTYRNPEAAPQSRIPAERRGRVVGRFCHVCATTYPLHRAAHSGKPLHGKDHVASPCAHEGDAFAAGADWWEPAVEVLPPAPAAAAT
jgi:hypothetical protein